MPKLTIYSVDGKCTLHHSATEEQLINTFKSIGANVSDESIDIIFSVPGMVSKTLDVLLLAEEYKYKYLLESPQEKEEFQKFWNLGSPIKSLRVQRKEAVLRRKKEREKKS